MMTVIRNTVYTRGVTHYDALTAACSGSNDTHLSEWMTVESYRWMTIGCWCNSSPNESRFYNLHKATGSSDRPCTFGAAWSALASLCGLEFWSFDQKVTGSNHTASRVIQQLGSCTQPLLLCCRAADSVCVSSAATEVCINDASHSVSSNELIYEV